MALPCQKCVIIMKLIMIHQQSLLVIIFTSVVYIYIINTLFPTRLLYR